MYAATLDYYDEGLESKEIEAAQRLDERLWRLRDRQPAATWQTRHATDSASTNADPVHCRGDLVEPARKSDGRVEL